MTRPAGPRTRRGRSAAVLLALGALTLTGCAEGDEDETAQTSAADGGGEDAANTSGAGDEAANTGDDASDADEESTGEDGDEDGEEADGDDEPAAAPTEPADIDVAADGREVSQGDGEIFATGAPVAFTTSDGNISCVMTGSNATCQVADKTYTAPADQMVASSLGECSAEDADAIILSEEQGAWTCTPQPLAPIGALGQGGWWAAQIDGDTVDADGTEAAVLPNGQDLKLGSITCSAAEDGVTCVNPDIGKQIFVSRSAYRYG